MQNSDMNWKFLLLTSVVIRSQRTLSSLLKGRASSGSTRQKSRYWLRSLNEPKKLLKQLWYHSFVPSFHASMSRKIPGPVSWASWLKWIVLCLLLSPVESSQPPWAVQKFCRIQGNSLTRHFSKSKRWDIHAYNWPMAATSSPTTLWLTHPRARDCFLWLGQTWVGSQLFSGKIALRPSLLKLAVGCLVHPSSLHP